MPQLTLETYHESDRSLPISADYVVKNFMFGIPLCTRDGRELSLEVIEEKIKNVTSHLENWLNIKLTRQVVSEEADFIRSEWVQWGYLQCNYPVLGIKSLKGYINNIIQIEYPSEWISFKSSSEEILKDRNVFLVPAGSQGAETNSLVFSGITPHLGFFGFDRIPNYWNIEYCTGFEKVPGDLKEVIGKLVAIEIFAILGDILLGAGIASTSLGFDGLSQSITTTQSAENSAYSARVRQYQKDLKSQLPKIKDYYSGFNFTVV